MFYYLTHPEVVQDPAIPVPRWPLNEVGRTRMIAIATAPWLSKVTRIISSDEQKALDAAEILSSARNIPTKADPAMGEIDRSATGYLPQETFWPVVERFFAQPHTSPDGWETAIAAQTRIMNAVRPLMSDTHPGATLLVGHGAIGTLLWCALTGTTIARDHDQHNSGGSMFAFSGKGEVFGKWVVMEEFVAP